MAKTFRFPDVGEGITEGEIVHWLVAEGDPVRADQTIAEIETDKAVVEMPSPYAGIVLKLHHQEKDIVKVGDALITIGEKGESAEAAVSPPGPKTAAAPPAAPAVRPAPGAVPEILATPMIRKLAQETGVDLSAVRGTGPLGRITEDDVRKAQAAPSEARPLAVKVKAKYDFFGDVERVALRGLRRATAKHMAQSVSTAAHVTHFDEADASALARAKSSLLARAGAVKLTYLPLIVKALIAALRLHPFFNSEMDDEEQEIVLKKYYNIGIAVDVPDGLIVPVVKSADQKTVFEIAAEIAALAASARARTLDLADLKGGTFSITNVGVLGGEWATPIINYPEAAILATMKIADRVRVRNGAPVVRSTLPLCLSFDHRIIDGAEAARFMGELKAILEDEARLLAALEV
jgi:pyruvate dehydrogenase E2 component (dihydrolipoamide acetyltransferase)